MIVSGSKPGTVSSSFVLPADLAQPRRVVEMLQQFCIFSNSRFKSALGII